jgi:NADH:ubiquinone reductase (H+-translocating)
VIGGGLTSIEIVTELAESFPGLRLTLVTAGTFGGDLSAAGQAHLRAVFARRNIALLEGVRVERLEAGRLLTSGGQTIPFDACLWTAGLVAPPLAREGGLPVNSRGQVQVDSMLRVPGYEAVSVVGDSAAVELPWGALRMGCVSAMPMGAYAADRLAADLTGKPVEHFRFGFIIRCISLGRRDGLVQMVTADDTPAARIITGWRAALVKEFIGLGTAWAIRIARYLPRSFAWSQPDSTVAAADKQAYARQL